MLFIYLLAPSWGGSVWIGLACSTPACFHERCLVWVAVLVLGVLGSRAVSFYQYSLRMNAYHFARPRPTLFCLRPSESDCKFARLATDQVTKCVHEDDVGIIIIAPAGLQ